MVMVNTRIRKVIIACSTCETELMVIHNAIIPFHFRCLNLACYVCDTVLSSPDLVEIWEIEPEHTEHDFINKEELR